MILKKKTNTTPKETPINTTTPKRRQQVITPPLSITHDDDSMKDLFFIVKGQYRKGVEPSFVNRVSGDVSYIGGYDPSSNDTETWYMVMDKITFHCFSCGSDFNKVLNAIHTVIMKYKGSAKKYFKHVSDTTSDDYYEVHYLGRTPLTPEQRSKKAEGRCPRVSPVMQEHYKAIYEMYGDFYRDQIEEVEDLAYSDLEEVIRDSRPINKTKKRLGKTKAPKVEMETPKESVTQTLEKKVVKPKVKLGVKKLSVTTS